MHASRRQVLTSIGLSGLALAGGAPRARAAALRPVHLLLDWIYQGPNSGFMFAKDKGFYSDAGLDVTITPGKGSGSTAQLIANDVADFGFSDGFVVGNAVSKGLDLEMLAAIYRRNPAGVMVLESSPIKTPKDLEGRTIAITPGSGQSQQFPAFLKGCGVDGAKVNVVNIDPSGATAAVLTHRVDALAAYVQGNVPAIEARGHEPVRTLWYADCGVNVISNGIIAKPGFVKRDPELVRDFVAATLKGFLAARQNPDAAAATVKRYLPTVDLAVTRREFELSWKGWVTPNTAGKPLGWMSDKDWASTVATLKEYGGVTSALDPASLYTNAFIPTGADFVPPRG